MIRIRSYGINPNVMTIFSNNTDKTSTSTRIGEGNHIGSNAVMGSNVQIAFGAVVGALAGVHRSIEEKAIFTGFPAKKIRDLD